MAIQKPGLTNIPAQPAAPARVARTGTATKSAFETALARKSATLGQPAAASAGAVNPSTGMTPEQAQFIERTLGQSASRTILSMPQPKARNADTQDGIDGE